MVLVVGGATGAEPQQGRALDVQELARLAQRMASDEHMRIKDAIAHVVEQHPAPDGSLANKKQVYAAALTLRE